MRKNLFGSAAATKPIIGTPNGQYYNISVKIFLTGF